MILLLALLVSAEYKVRISPENSRIEWTLGATLHSAHGTFALKRGNIWFDPATGRAGGEIVIDADSGESGNSTRDARMKKVVLETGKYPEITFRPDRIEGALNMQGASDVKLHGQFLIHGGTHEIWLPTHAVIERDRMEGAMKFVIPYVEWGMKDPGNLLLKVDKTVGITIQARGSLGKGL